MKTYLRCAWTVVAFVLSHLDCANAETTKLIVATLVDPGTVVNTQVIEPWAKRVNDQGKGVLELIVREGPALGDFGNIYDRVLSNVVQIGFGLQSAVGGKFPLTNVLALPFLYDNDADASQAFWRVYKSGVLNSEYDQIVPLMLVGFSSASLHFVKPLQSLDTLAGSKIIVPGKVQSDVITTLGGAPISLKLTEEYEALQRHTADGTMIAWLAFNPWKLAEVTTYDVDTELGAGAGMIFMAKQAYEALSPEARRILEANSGERESRSFGQAMQVENDNQRTAVASSPKHTIVTLTTAQRANWQKKLEPIVARWAAQSESAATVLSRFHAAMSDIKAGK